mmetsp:Transcript_92889/g.220834  ORF Transcript_92889/g.220834 Transcript_92889/m.220834 type:complete len:203 (-) Transcript_92889:227-835(-)
MQGFDGGDIVVSHIEAVKLRQGLHTFDGAQLVLCQAKRPQLQVLQIPNLKDQVLGEVQQAQLLIAQEPIADVADVVASQVELPQEAMHFPISELRQHVVRHVTSLEPVRCSEVLTPDEKVVAGVQVQQMSQGADGLQAPQPIPGDVQKLQLLPLPDLHQGGEVHAGEIAPDVGMLPGSRVAHLRQTLTNLLLCDWHGVVPHG